MTSSFFSSSTTHSGFTGSISNFISSIFGIIASLFNSVLALFQAVFALGANVVQSAFSIVQHFVAMILDIFSGAIGFVAGNFVAIALCIGAYFAWTTYQQRNGSVSARTRSRVN